MKSAGKKNRSQQMPTHKRERVFDLSYTVFMIAFVCVALALAVLNVKPVSENMYLNRERKRLSVLVTALQESNADLENDIANMIDLERVREIAERNGLTYPKSGQKILVSANKSDYFAVVEE